MRKRGYSKNGRGDAPQVVIGLAVTRDGFPVRHWVFPGNTVDVSTVEKVKRELPGWINRCVFVGDAGMVSVEPAGPCSWRGSLYCGSSCALRRGSRAGSAQSQGPLSAGDRLSSARRWWWAKESAGDAMWPVITHMKPNARNATVHRFLKSWKHQDPESFNKYTASECALRSSRRYGRYVRYS